MPLKSRGHCEAQDNNRVIREEMADAEHRCEESCRLQALRSLGERQASRCMIRAGCALHGASRTYQPHPRRNTGSQLTGLQKLARLWQTTCAPAGARIPTRSKSQGPTTACFRLQAGCAHLTSRVATCEALKAQLQERARHSKVATRCHPNLVILPPEPGPASQATRGCRSR